MSNAGRSTTGDAAVPYYPTTPAKEVAKFVRLVLTRFINDRANKSEVEEAIEMLRKELSE